MSFKKRLSQYGRKTSYQYTADPDDVCPVSETDHASYWLTKELMHELAVSPLVVTDRVVALDHDGQELQEEQSHWKNVKEPLAARRSRSIKQAFITDQAELTTITEGEQLGNDNAAFSNDQPQAYKKRSLKRKATDISIEIPKPLKEVKPLKTGKQRLRWNLLFNIIVYIIVPLPIWLPYVSEVVSHYVVTVIQAVFVAMWVVISVCAARNLFKLFRKRGYDFTKDYPFNTDIQHLFVMTCYKEPIYLIAATVQTVASQTEVGRASVTIGFEEKTPDVDAKISQLKGIFASSGFRRLIFTKHPPNQPNEIPGKCSNLNHAIRESVEVLKNSEGRGFSPDQVIVTTFDADTQFHPQYIEALTSLFFSTPDPTRHEVMYQAPLLYNWGLDGASFVTRITGILRSTLMMGALIPFNINTMSNFSSSLKLQIQGNFTHPGYQMEDIICLIRWMGVTRKRLRILTIPLPVISGPTSGQVIELEIMEWARQARRWTIGAAEVFHYYVVKAPRIPVKAAVSWGICFLIYYGVLLCSGGLFSVTATISMSCIMTPPSWMSIAMYTMLGIQYACFAVAFLIDILAPRLMEIKEYISVMRNVVHWLLTPFVLIGYSVVELYALHEVVIRGKEVCKHGASKKEELTKNATLET